MPQATKVAAHLQRTGASSGGPTFVWTKKIERELESGKTVRDIANAQSRLSQAERMVGHVEEACLRVELLESSWVGAG